MTHRIHAHIATIRQKGEFYAKQLRINGGGRGNTHFFSLREWGSEAAASEAAERMRETMDALPPKGRGGSVAGRVTRLSKTNAAGIRFGWTRGGTYPVLVVYATRTDPGGKARNTSYSTQLHRLEGALDRALAWRAANGQPAPSRGPLLRLLRQTYAKGPPAGW